MIVSKPIDWDSLAILAKETGKSILIGHQDDFDKREKRLMAQEATKRKLCISLGNPDIDPDEEEGEYYVTAKL